MSYTRRRRRERRDKRTTREGDSRLNNIELNKSLKLTNHDDNNDEDDDNRLGRV